MEGNVIQGEIYFASKFFDMIDEGKKTTTVRRGARAYTPGLYNTYSPARTVHGYVWIDNTQVTTLGALTEEVAHTDGFNSLEELKNELLSFYPELTDDSEVTIVTLRKDDFTW